ncbi:hypothetical protein NKH18_35715 [Streptomyces sp. M10(2022)]
MAATAAPRQVGRTAAVTRTFRGGRLRADVSCPQWLRELGYDAPEESVVDAGTACATAVFAPPVGHVADWKSLLLTASPDEPRQGC